MNIAQLFADVRQMGITIALNDNELVIEGRTDLLTDALIDKIRGNKQALINFLNNAKIRPGITAADAGNAGGAAADGATPVLSFGQERLWFLDQLDPGSALYNIPAAIRLTGTLDTDAFGRTLNEVVRRHAALRTTIITVNGAAVQVIAPEMEIALPLTDLSDLPDSEREARAQWLVQDEVQTPFALATGPLIRARLLRLASNEHIVLFTMHHIVSDGWSMGVLVKEVVALYSAYVQHLPSPLPPLAIQYTDFAQWQRQWLSGEVLTQQVSYWTDKLADATPLLALPTDRLRPPVQSFRGAILPFTVATATTTRLYALGQRCQATLFMTLMAAFNVLLARYSGQSDISIGTPNANRNRAELEPLIGFFINNLVLRSQVNPGDSFETLLQQVRGAALGAYAHQDVPFEQLVEAIKPERHLDHAPLFQVMLVLQNTPMDSLELPGLTLQLLPFDNATAKFDLMLSLTEVAGQLTGAFEYSTDLFDDATIARMAGHFTCLLEAIVANPAAQVGDLPLMTAAERSQLLQTPAPAGDGAGIPLRNPRSYVLDARLALCPIGIPGDLYLGGEYAQLNLEGQLPALAADSLLPDPFNPAAGARMVRTGNRAKYLADGALLHLGRCDQKINLRGFQIELDKIDAALAALPEVRECVVVARNDVALDSATAGESAAGEPVAETAAGGTQLVAYVVPQDGVNLAEAESFSTQLRAALVQTLPGYMIPAHFMQMDALPLAADGSLDRAALPAPVPTASAQAYVAPRNQDEATLAVIWAELLGLEQVGVHDNFFTLGGHSLLAVILIEQMNQAGLRFDVSALFSTPTIAGLAAAARVENNEVDVPPNLIPAASTVITQDMLTLITLTQEEIAVVVETAPGGVPNIQDIYPLAPLQEGILFHHRVSAQGDVYLLPTLIGFDTRPQLDGFLNALQMVIDRHDILRTAVLWEGLAEPLQVVYRHVPLHTEEIVLDAANGAPIAQLRARYNPRSYRMDVRQAPLLRAIIVQDHSNGGKWLLQMLAHHLAVDHIALKILIGEIQMILQGLQDQLPLALPFRNFVAQARLGVSKEEHERFFGAMLADVTEPTTPFGLMEVRNDDIGITEFKRKVDPALTERIRQRARTLGVSAASLMHLAWAQVLARASGRQNVVFGTVLIGRMQGGAGSDRVMGMFVNTLPVRIDIGKKSVTESVHETHALLTQLLRHEHAPLVLAQRCSQVAAPAPLFTALLNYRHGEAQAAEADASVSQAWQGVEILAEEERNNFPLTLSVDDLGEEFFLTAQVSVSVQAQRVCDYMHTALEHLIEALDNAPATAANAIEVLPAAERTQLLQDWNNTATAYPKTQVIHQLFEAQAAASPDGVAVTFDGSQLSYAALNARANQLAHHLRSMGVGPDVLVGICIERSLDMIVALLAILKAGGGYLPLDPNYPKERLSYMLGDAKPVVLLTQQHLLADLPANAAASTVDSEASPVLATFCLDTQAAQLATYPDTNPVNAAAPSNLAYVMYTSGSTGQPKGIVVTHQNVVRLVKNTHYFSVDATNRVLQFAPISFDASTFEVWGALLNGVTLVVLAPGRLSIAELGAAITAQKVDTLWLTAALFNQMVEHQLPSLAGACHILAGGEALSASHVRQFLDASPAARLTNGYGPTESTTFACCHPILAQSALTASVPIGQPIANTQAYILDADLNPVPVGVAGELHIAGDGLARGYLQRPGMTADKFIPNPFGPAGSRMYKSGDLTRYLPNGDIDYLGRIDDQVKIRGFRIELGEIEAALAALPAVQHCVVLAREDVPGDKRLVAYLVPQDSLDASDPDGFATRLRAALGQALPGYMIPAFFMLLDQFPLTANGKVDRKALPAPDAVRSEIGYTAPRNPVEESMAVIWADILGLDKVGIHDNFFSIGGHSLLAIKLIERMRRDNLQIDVRALFSSPTIAELAPDVGGASAEVEVPPNLIPPGSHSVTPEMLTLVTLTPDEIATVVRAVPGGAANIQDIYPLAPLQEGILFHHRMSQEGDFYLLPSITGFDTRARLDGFLAALQQVIDRHDILRTIVLWEGLAEPVQVVCRQVPMINQEITLDIANGDPIEQLRARYNPRHFRIDVRQAPLLRGYIARDDNTGKWLLQILAHHLAVDHTSMAILIGEIQMILQARQDQLPLALPFRNFVAQARLGVSQAEHEQFFTTMLAGVDEPTAPFGLLDVRNEDVTVTECKRLLDPVLAQRVRQRARALGVSAASLMHLAWAQVLGRASRRQEVVFGTILIGRMQSGAGADRVLGMFINTLPVRIDIGAKNVTQSVQETHALLTQLLRHEHAPLVLAQRCSSVSAAAPLFTSLLNYRHSAVPEADAETTLAWEGVEVLAGEERTNYPLTLAVDDLGEGFSLTVQVGNSVPAQRVCDYMRTALENLVEALENAPATAINAIEVLPADERNQLLVEWNNTGNDFGNESAHDAAPMPTMVQVFEAQTGKTPAAIAVIFDDTALSYAALNARANQLAHHLRSIGVGPDVLVGICIERSLDMIVGLLAILKAGGAYLPLDPSYPKDRLAYMLDDAKPAVLLTQSPLLSMLPDSVATMGNAVFCLDTQAAALAAYPLDNPAHPALAGNLAYVIYTSGSTGKPKGVLLQHGGLSNLVEAQVQAFQVRASQRVLQFASFNFDASTSEIFMALSCGATLCMASRDDLMPGNGLQQTLQHMAIDVVTLPPVALNVLSPQNHAALTTLIVAGEACSRSLVDQWAPERAFFNAYGPTEASVCATLHRCSAGQASPPPIGRPIAHAQIYILDANLNPVPVGVAGELHIAGDGLARGYLQRPGMTADKFIPNPFASAVDATGGSAGSRMYKSGDLARYLPNGDIDYLGRIDDQVKIRGFRIELGEIEAALAALPAVRDCAVLARNDGSAPGDKRLAAYVVLREGANALATAADVNVDADALVAQLRAGLLQTLPDYMIPAHFIVLAQLPLTPNGKLNRKALPAPDMVRSERGYVAPRTATEQTLAAIWADILGLDKVGIHDNFFILGGHSLLATQVVSKVRAAFDIDLPLRSLFEASDLAALATMIDLAQQAPAESLAPAITPASRSGPLALSFAQQRLWFLDQLEPGSALYNIPGAIRLTGKLNIAAFGRTINEVVRRHEALRTTFATVDGGAVQIIAAALELPLPLTDLSDLPRAEREARTQWLVQDEALIPFDLSSGPLLRARLLRLGDDEHIVLFTMHHIVSDGWSMGVLVKEVATLYAAYVQDLPSPLPKLAVQYADFAQWQRQWLRGDVLAKQIDYWRTQLADSPTLLALPTDRPRPAVQTYRGASLPFTLSADTTASLHALSQRQQATLFMTLTAAFNVLMARYAGQSDICIGTPIANRNRAETEALIGFFINTLVLRAQVNASDAFTSLLQQVRNTALGAFAHQDVPFEQLVDALKPERSLGHSPLFQVMLVLQNTPAGTLTLPALTMQAVPFDNTSAKFDLTLDMTETDGQLSCGFQYNTDLFDAATIARMAGHFTRLLDAIVQNPACRIGDLPLMGAAEQQQLLLEWNNTATVYPAAASLQQLFEAQVAATPEAVALVFDDAQLKGVQLSYAELNARANRLAHHLRSLGVGPDVLVGVCAERSLEMVIGLYAILKAGGAYVPLDPAYPSDRLAFMLDDANPAVLLTQSTLLASLPPQAQNHRALFCLDTQWGQLAGYPTDNPTGATGPAHAANLAYVIYTSGSTGRPKGVGIDHAGIINRLQWMQAAYQLTAADRVLQKTPFSFDVSVWEFFWPLITGATLIVAKPGGHQDADYLADLIGQYAITTLHFVPPMLEVFLNAAGAAQCASLRQVMCSGQALPGELQQRFLRQLPNAALHNLYGPTEASVDVTFWQCRAETKAVPIGRPIANIQIHILDAQLNPVPQGVAGELHIAGIGLARGYINRPDLSADKFIPNPFASAFGAAGTRMYKSGDLARYLADGVIEYLGRIDDQVKIRGFRIELGEIEAALAALPAVRECIVLAREDVPGVATSGDKRLVAYVVRQQDASASADATETDTDTDADTSALTAQLRTALAQTLPDYMVPAHFILLNQLPLTTNGKVDRKALPAPDMVRSERGYVAPRDATEEALAAIWADILGLDKVGIHDNFFALGGHSLLATQVISKVRTAFGIDLPLRALFEAPDLAALAAMIGLAQQAPAGALAPAITPASRTGPLALSFAQQRLWFLDQLEPGSALYNIPGAIRLTGSLDVAAFGRALNEVVRRHEALRTTFATVNDGAVQIITSALDLRLPLTDLSALPHAEREARAQWLVQDEVQTPFDLSSGPLIRARLLRLNSNEHIVLFTMHHIVSDGWSIGVLVKEVATLYAAYVQDLPSPLPELAVQYADFAQWQRQWLRGDVLAKQIDYWRTQLADSPTLLALPTDRPRPAVQTYQGASVPFTLAADLTASLHALSQRQQATLFMTLTAAFNVLLARYAGQSDICIGTPIANRNRAETEALIGFFVNTLVLRAQVNAADGFDTLLQQVRATALGAYAHQDVPFEQLVDALKPERHLGHSPLFQVLFVLQNTPAGSLDLPGLSLQPVSYENTSAKFDLTLDITETAGQLSGAFGYNTDLFDTATIARMAGHFTRLLDAIVQNPACRIGDLPLMGAAEQQQLLLEWNNTATVYPAAASLQQLFEAQVASTPEAVALVFDDTQLKGVQLSYAELNARANRLAHHLRSLGVGPDVLVGVCAERSLEMVISLYAILKAGGAYVPLDPAYPSDRLAFMLDDANPAVLLTQSTLLASLPPQAQNHRALFCLDTQWGQLAGYPTDNPTGATGPAHAANLAYVIYTSGSTGRPKGVGIDHAGIINRLQWMQAAYQLTAADRVLQKTPFSFDVSVWEFFWPLITGATLIVAKPGGHQDADYLADLIGQYAITTLHFVPPMLEVFLNAAGAAQCASLRQVMCSGQALPGELQQRFLRQLPNAALHNLYGPTEASVDVTFWQCRAETKAVPIGRPIANIQIHILDAQLNPVPQGVAGELHIAGIGLARGYINRPDLSADKFIPNPFASAFGAAGTRMYKSGDLARYLADGVIEYLGRIDDQVKIRGFRIELGEIEAALAALPAVRECIVLAREDAPGVATSGDKRLVAYVVTDDSDADADTSTLTAQLRTALAQTLPDYMVPAHFIVLSQLPLTTNGKVDRKALPAPDMVRSERGYVAPRDATEETLAAIWADILGLDKVGIHDNFFALGGHSLLATQVISKVRTAFDIDLPLRSLFEAPDLAALAAMIGLAQQAPAGALAPAITPASRTGPLALSFAQQRLWFLDQLEPGSALYNIPGAIRLTGSLDVAAFGRALNEVVRRHEALRTTFATVNDGAVQVITSALDLRLPLTDLSALPHAEREARAQWLVQDEVQTPFDLSSGPLIRARLLRLNSNEHIVLFTMHHIVSDGWSIGVLVKEVATLYAAYVQDLPSPLPELAVQYADFAQWQRQWLRGDVLAKQIDYWRTQLADSPTLLALPTDRPRPAVQTYQGASVPFTLAADLTASLHALSQRQQATLFMTLTAAFNVLLARYAGQSDICIGTPIANRNRAETEALIGFFVNTLVLRAQVNAADGFDTLLQQVRATALGAYAHQDVPFEQLVDALKPERHLGHSPLFQVLFVLQNTPTGSLDLPGLTLEAVSSDSASAKFDLTLSITETDGQLSCGFQYNTDLFDAATITRMAGHFTRLLQAIIADPTCRIGDLPLLGQTEQQQMLLEWNNTAAGTPAFETMHQWFEAQTDKTPEAVAVVFDGTQLTYAQLNTRANQLAHHLRSLGVGPDGLVGICVERTLDMIVGLFAILKAGGAYVPLDPNYPSDRLAYMLADARPAVLLTQSHLLRSLPPTATDHRAVFCLDTEWDRLARYPATNPVNASLPANLAYIIYTSGSTGQPKGIGIAHHNASVFIAWALASFDSASLQRVLASTSMCFDLSIFEMYVPLAQGGAVWLVNNILDLSAKPSAYPVTLINTVPSAIAEILRSDAIPASVSVINLAGEALSNTLVQALYRQESIARIFNLYGPSEDTTYSTYTLTVKGASASASIGRPIANTQVYLLDAQLNPVPAGVAGELHIGGDGLARGYLHRPDLSADKFIPNPFGAAGTRIYKTGDLARYLPNGDIEYMGRIDHQVKIRGFRIELGEIETALLTLPAVRDCVVLAREDAPGDKRLAAYVVARNNADAIDAEALTVQLRAALAQTLPEYMIPAHFMLMAQLPLTPNGKLDRKALPAPDTVRSERGYVAPTTPTEAALAAIWATILGLDKVGASDNFFALGGHSLLATQVISKVRTAFSIDLPLRALFEAPDLAALAAMITLAQQAPADALAPAITPASRTGPLALSFSQQRLWFLDQLEPGSALYNIPGAIRLTGNLDLPAFGRALNEVVRRHEALRTTFAAVNDDAVQIIAPALDLRLPLTDLSALPRAEREARAQWLVQDEVQTPFDLSNGPLIRARLLRLDANEHIVLFTLHHIVSDGWSMGVLVREVATLYAAYVQNLPSPLPELAVQYADFARWQRQWLSGDVLSKQIDYWRAQLANGPTLLTLPTDRPRPAVQSFRGASLPFTLAADTTAGLQALSQRQQATLFMTLTAALNVLMARYSGQSDICIGTPIANRNRAETEPLIGFFINTLVLRAQVNAADAFTTLLQQVRNTALGAYAHQDVPFEQLVDALKPERHLGHAPLFQVMLVLQNTPAGNMVLPGLTLEAVTSDNASAKFDLTLSLTEANGQLLGNFQYNTDLFDATTMARMAGHFTGLLHAIIADPACRIGDLPLMQTTEQNQVLLEWNDTAAAYPKTQTIHRLFEAQAAKTPAVAAVVFEGAPLTYADLNARANRLAHHLRSLGVGPDVLVGLCVERSLDMMVGLLAILKAGGAYVPLDPSYPKDRLAYMIGDAKPLVLLTQAHLLPGLPANLPAGVGTVFCLDTQSSALTGYPAGNPGNTAVPDNLAYVIYTSGSTGTPKGIGIGHRSAINLINGLVQTVYQDIGDLSGKRIGVNASFSFDGSVKQLLLILHGVSLHLVPDAMRADADLFAGAMRDWQLDGIDCTPSQLSMLLAVDGPVQLPNYVLIGGEAIDRPLWHTLQRNTRTRFYNMYGPTEATVDTAICPIQTSGTTPVLGRPIPNVQVYLLDASLNPTPIGVAGELHIAGDGLARGYLKRPGMTADKFIPNPFGMAGSRMYRSGDLARYLPDGKIEYMGRIDDQIKIRGFRIELGEIETALAALPAVRDCVVLVREDIPGDKRLVAYVAPRADASESNAEALMATLRAALLQSLPGYMVPAHFMALEQFPLTPNGKIDRKALPAPDMIRSELGYVAPRTTTETALAAIWAGVLGLDKVGIHDNFFALGGHSLLSIKLVNAIKQQFDINFPLAAIFTAPTVAAIATIIEGGQRANSLLAPLQTEGPNRPLFFAHPVGGSIFFYQKLAQQLGRQFPVYGIQSPEIAGLPMRFETIDQMAAAYCEEIKKVQPDGPYRLAGWSTGGLLALAMAATLEQQGDSVEYVGLFDSRPIQQDGDSSEEAELLQAAITTLAALRGRGFSQDELLDMARQLAAQNLSVQDLLSNEQSSALIHFLNQWANTTLTADMLDQLKARLTLTKDHRVLLTQPMPSQVKAPLHYYLPEGAALPANAPLEFMAVWSTPGNTLQHQSSVVTGDHYSMLSEPHVKLLGELVAAALNGSPQKSMADSSIKEGEMKE
jgi:amino acid adenylation domain-containing protein